MRITFIKSNQITSMLLKDYLLLKTENPLISMTWAYKTVKITYVTLFFAPLQNPDVRPLYV